jgi:hypothetical protein
LILDHLLWPLLRAALEVRERRHSAHIVNVGRGGFDKTIRLGISERENIEDMSKEFRER